MDKIEIREATEGQKLTMMELVRLISQMDDDVMIDIQLVEGGDSDA